jgi:enhancing lycopene biosynthesis protein 2
MSLNNFIPEVWAGFVHKAKENSLVAARVSNRSYEGEIKQAGDRVKVNMFADPTIGNYTKYGTITPEQLTASQRELLIDQQKYFSFYVDDIDSAQANMGLIAEPLNRAGYKLADTADAYLLGLYAQAGMAQNTNDTPVDLVSTNVEEEVLALGELFNNAKLPFEGRFLIVAPWVITKMVLAGLTTKTSNDAMWANGFVDRILGFNVYMSQNVSKNSSSWDKTRNIAGIANESFGFAEQIVKVEAYRPESSFSDAVKGLHVYGGKIMRPDSTCVWYADKTAEA